MSNLPTSPPDPDRHLAEALRHLRALPPAEPSPFFYARVRHRLLAAEQPPALLWWLRRPAYIAAAFSVLLALNAGAAVHYVQHQGKSAAATATTAYDSFVTEYQLTPYEVAYE